MLRDVGCVFVCDAGSQGKETTTASAAGSRLHRAISLYNKASGCAQTAPQVVPAAHRSSPSWLNRPPEYRAGRKGGIAKR
eukprot:3169535-Pyramimonas_sp.AAC.1